MTSARGWSERHGLWRSAPVQHTVYRTTQAVGMACVAKVRPVDVRVTSYRCKRHWPRTHAHKAPTQSSMHAHMHKDNHARMHLTRTHTPCMQTPFVVSRCTYAVLASARSASKCIPRCAVLGACSRPLPCCAVQAPAPARPSVDPDGQANAPHARGCKCDTCLRAKWSAIQQALGPTLGTRPAACNLTVSDEETEAAAKRKWAVPRAGAGAVRPQPQQRRATETGTSGLQTSAAAARDVAPPPRRHTSYAVERAAAAVQPAGGRPVVAAKAREVGGPSTRQNFDKRSAVRLC
jgi:hypothetical protein